MNNEETPSMDGYACPIPLPHDKQIVLGHGSGGRMSYDLIRKTFVSVFKNPILSLGDDAARIRPIPNVDLAVSTDAHVVWPLFFPGGDIGRLAVCGTVNDVSMLGADPQYLTASFILEEGLPIDTLTKVIKSMQIAADEAGIQIIAGDTKVVQKGKADGMYISTSGLGIINSNSKISGGSARPGDKIILSGTIGDHGIAVLAARGELGFFTSVKSDVAPLNHMVKRIIESSDNIHVLRDPTRGGLATTLNEIARQSNVCIQIFENSIPVQPEVSAACEMLGFDPIYIANEGKLVAFVAPEDADRVLDCIRTTPLGENAVIIGDVLPQPANRVLMKTAIGASRIVDMLSGEMLPRIC